MLAETADEEVDVALLPSAKAPAARRYSAIVWDMARAKATVYLDPDVLRAMRIRAARTGRRDSDVVEEALREYLGLAVIDRIRSRSDLTPEEAERLANEELHAARRERRGSVKS